MSERIIAYCGSICTECPAYIATQKNDRAGLVKTAEEWSAMFNIPIAADDCICDGCLGAGRMIPHCRECKVRACAIEHGVPTCAHCSQYNCDTLTAFLAQSPEAKASLEAIRRTLS